MGAGRVEKVPYQHVNGIRLRYEAWGAGEWPLVLLHGLGSSADDWIMQLGALAPHYRCVAVDLRGHGLSDRPAGAYSIALFASDVVALVQSLGLAPAHVFGLSLGGMVAQQMAMAQPAVVRSLVLLNTLPGLWPPVRGTARLAARRLSPPWRRRSMDEQAARVAADLFPRPEHAPLRAQARARLAANDPIAYRRAIRAIVGYRPGSALSRIACPALIMAGTADRVVPAAYQVRLRRALPRAAFVAIPDGGHACNLEWPEPVNAAVLAFLQSVDRVTPGTPGHALI